MPTTPPLPPRRAIGPRPAAECAAITKLGARARELDRIDQRFRQSLPAPLNQQLRFAAVRGSRAVLLAPSPAWAARARVAQTRILALLRTLGVQADSIVVKVMTAPPVKTEVTAPVPVSAATARHLRAAAMNMQDPELQALFLELASFAEGDSSS